MNSAREAKRRSTNRRWRRRCAVRCDVSDTRAERRVAAGLLAPVLSGNSRIKWLESGPPVISADAVKQPVCRASTVSRPAQMDVLYKRPPGRGGSEILRRIADVPRSSSSPSILFGRATISREKSAYASYNVVPAASPMAFIRTVAVAQNRDSFWENSRRRHAWRDHRHSIGCAANWGIRRDYTVRAGGVAFLLLLSRVKAFDATKLVITAADNPRSKS